MLKIREGTSENWYALYLSIILNFSSDKALKYFSFKLNTKHRNYSLKHIEIMIKLKKNGVRYKEIGEKYGITRSQVKAILQYHSKRKGR
ncbi:hypothetical protein [Clostridium felsineum]|uniref:Uncharacterized protein n=1 Tax=Clostridium felsineum TaxID=36839 RepID=A0A1S8LRG3_9CLOT|nr:hypothetical protein [Clostridium felsineum]URZ05871.1 hypothetical protein CLROS_012030 [Clostridium felsineum]URZ10908.1 hypothetical protein CROST_016240 [Clostridium felsineum]